MIGLDNNFEVKFNIYPKFYVGAWVPIGVLPTHKKPRTIYDN